MLSIFRQPQPGAYPGSHQLVRDHLGEELSSLGAHLGVGGVTEEVQQVDQSTWRTGRGAQFRHN